MSSYGTIENAIRRVDDRLSNLTAPPDGTKITKLAFTWNEDGTMATLNAYNSDELLFTLTFSWNPDGTLAQVVRT